MISHLKNRKFFIKEVLKEVSNYLSKKNNYKSKHTYKKGYLLDADILAHNFICSAIQEHFPKDLIFSEEDEKPLLNEIWYINTLGGSAKIENNINHYIHSISVNVWRE